MLTMPSQSFILLFALATVAACIGTTQSAAGPATNQGHGSRCTALLQTGTTSPQELTSVHSSSRARESESRRSGQNASRGGRRVDDISLFGERRASGSDREAVEKQLPQEATRPEKTHVPDHEIIQEQLLQQTATPEGAKALALIPVSITMYCVLVLTSLFMIVSTALAIARNVDELAGRGSPSGMTQILSLSMRSATYAPMLAVLFVGCRMYVLESTGDTGEPLDEVKQAMIAVTAGMLLEQLLVLLLPMITTREHERKAGGAHDVHPNIFTREYVHASMFHVAWMGQCLAMLLIYAGVLVVILGTFGRTDLRKPIPPALGATISLAFVYFLVYGLLFVTRTLQGINEYRASLGSKEVGQIDDKTAESKLAKFALCASYPLEVTPMLAVLFLGARLRTSQMGIDPQPWAQNCFWACACILPLLSMLSGFIGMHAAEHIAYYGERLYEAESQTGLIVKHAMAACLYVSIITVFVSILVLEDTKHEHTPPFSPTLRCILQLAFQFLAVYCLQWFFSLLRELFSWLGGVEPSKGSRLEIIQETVIAAKASVQLCPMLSVLVLGCRMRALQISDNKGNPQNWAQDWISTMAFASLVQILCSLALPAFTGMATTTDDDGNATYDLQPLVAVYTVTFMKYIVLATIFGAVFFIGLSMFLITPEKALETMRDSHYAAMGAQALWFVVVFLVAGLISSAKVIGLAAKVTVESVDRWLLGVDVRIAAARLSLCQGFVNLIDVVIDNPPGHETPHLLRVKTISLHINLWGVICSLGKRIEIKAIILKNLDVVYEKTHTGSNVSSILDHLVGANAATEDSKLSNEAQPSGAEKNEVEFAAEGSTTEVLLRRIEIVKVRAELVAKVLGKATSMQVVLGDIRFPDFSEQQVSVQKIITLVVETILKSVVANSFKFGEGISYRATSMASQVKDGCMSGCAAPLTLMASGQSGVTQRSSDS